MSNWTPPICHRCKKSVASTWHALPEGPTCSNCKGKLKKLKNKKKPKKPKIVGEGDSWLSRGPENAP